MTSNKIFYYIKQSEVRNILFQLFYPIIHSFIVMKRSNVFLFKRMIFWMGLLLNDYNDNEYRSQIILKKYNIHKKTSSTTNHQLHYLCPRNNSLLFHSHHLSIRPHQNNNDRPLYDQLRLAHSLGYHLQPHRPFRLGYGPFP